MGGVTNHDSRTVYIFSAYLEYVFRSCVLASTAQLVVYNSVVTNVLVNLALSTLYSALSARPPSFSLPPSTYVA